MNRWMRGLIGLMLLCLPAAWGGEAEQRLMAVYLGRFAEYVQFSDARVDAPEFVLVVLGTDPFDGQLQALYQQRHIQQKPVRIVLAADLSEVPACDLLYVNLPTHAGRQAALALAREQQALSIGAARGFAAQGGIIQINFVEQKPRITINHTAAIRSGLQIRAPLLSIATVLQGEQP